jgi:hypothetical protein
MNDAYVKISCGLPILRREYRQEYLKKFAFAAARERSLRFLVDDFIYYKEVKRVLFW